MTTATKSTCSLTAGQGGTAAEQAGHLEQLLVLPLQPVDAGLAGHVAPPARPPSRPAPGLLGGATPPTRPGPAGRGRRQAGGVSQWRRGGGEGRARCAGWEDVHLGGCTPGWCVRPPRYTPRERWVRAPDPARQPGAPGTPPRGGTVVGVTDLVTLTPGHHDPFPFSARRPVVVL